MATRFNKLQEPLDSCAWAGAGMVPPFFLVVDFVDDGPTEYPWDVLVS